MRKYTFAVMLIIPFLCLLSLLVYQLPPVQERVAWRMDEWRARLKYVFSPPEQALFVPQQSEDMASLTPVLTPATKVIPSSTAIHGDPTPYLEAVMEETPQLNSPTPTISPTPLPVGFRLSGIRHEYQSWNNCGPATLAMALSYWGWQGNQEDVASVVKPNPRDKNVMPYELAGYIEAETSYQVIHRVGGDIDLLKRFLAARLPVMIEKGFEGADFDGWMGHYVMVTGYDDLKQEFTLQDSYYGPEETMEYQVLESFWRAFNYTYLVVYPSERSAEVMSALGPQSEKSFNNQFAAQKAYKEILTLGGRDQYFAWFNHGTNLVALQDYANAAAAFDQAFSLYPSIPKKQRPWRMLWYQTGPYWAYYYTGRYQDVIKLATNTLENMSEPVLEESFYWRALAREAVDDLPGAVKDLRTAVKVHPGFQPAIDQLERLGETP